MAIKKTQRNIIIGVIIILIILILIANGNIKLLLAVTGANTLSLSQASLTSSNPYLSGKAWLLTFNVGGLGQSYNGTITPSDIESKTSGDLRTTKTLKITVDNFNQQCIYPIQNAGQTKAIYDLQYKTWTCAFVPSETDAKSKSGLGILLYYGKYGIPDAFTCFSVGYNNAYQTAILGQVNVQSKYRVNLDVDGNIAYRDFDTLTGSTQGSIGNYAYGVWDFSGVTGQSCPYSLQNPYIPIDKNGKWILVNKQAYDNYVSNLNNPSSPDSTCKTIFFSSKKCFESWANNMVSLSQQSQIQQYPNLQFATGFSNAPKGAFTATPSQAVQLPVITLYIKADTLGIYTPASNVKIISSKSECFKTGSNTGGVVYVTLRNDGETGNYNAYLECQNPFMSSGNRQDSLGAGQTTTINLPITASASTKTTGVCTIKVQDTSGVDKSSTVNVCVDPQISCTTPYPKKFCGFIGNNEAVLQCSQDGGTTNTIQTCSIGQVCDAVNGICKDKGDDGGGNGDGSILDKIKDFFKKIADFFKNLFSGTFNFLKVVKYFIVFVAGLLSIFVSNDVLEDNIRSLRRNKIIRWIFAFIIGLGIGIVLALFIGGFIFWILVWVVLVYLFFASKIKKLL